MDETTEARAVTAAAEFLRRIGWTEVSIADERRGASIRGMDGEQVVAVIVTVIDRAAQAPPSATNGQRPSNCDRLDRIDITVIGLNRALLRHHRDAR